MTAGLDILDFWWRAGEPKWFARDTMFDEEIRRRFGVLHGQASAGAFSDWEQTADGALALILLLDQFSRNLYRDDARAFAQDPRAFAIAERALARGFDRAFPVPHRRFFFLPFEHAESLEAQNRSVALCEGCGDEEGAKYARAHRDVIVRFGRFPHRNAALGRISTPEEQAWLDAGGGW